MRGEREQGWFMAGGQGGGGQDGHLARWRRHLARVVICISMALLLTQSKDVSSNLRCLPLLI